MSKEKRKNEIKVVVVGSSDVGKTTLMENLIGKIGKVEYKGTTVAIDYGSIEINNKKIHFFGTPGQKRFEFMRDIALNGADFVVLVIDATVSLGGVDREIIDALKNKGIPYLIFINKTDLVEKSKIEEIKNELKSLNVDILEGSALNREGIDKIVGCILSQVN
ncbi:GTP-binding protein [Methanotorris igneus]|uniref:Small GTP-binding protein n=1 Tax=Methanotorris igneus (strain DSM 5666 / JCM 11834 / Kol 5) TaxID=880724 RepID=F6BDH8_METIK|nr:GTP-binding protein [Methanotorris igneus]AEF96539.1 small GTP-binding protein [Methanotorris igneus Kol 5]